MLLRRLWEYRGSMQRSLSLATDRVERILTVMKSQNVAIYNKKELCRKPAPFDKGAKNVAWGEGFHVCF